MSDSSFGRRGVPLGVGIRHDGKPDSSQRSVDDVIRALGAIGDVQKVGKVRFVSQDSAAGYNEVIGVETPRRTIEISLPSASSAPAGASVTVVKACDDYVYEVGISSTAGETVMGDTRILLSGAWNYVRLVAFPGIKAWICAGGDRDGRWTDLRVIPTARAGATAPVSTQVNLTGIYLDGFPAPAGPVETLIMRAQLPHGYWPGTALRPHIHWMPDATARAPNDAVAWRIDVQYGTRGSYYGSALTLVTMYACELSPTPWVEEITPFYLTSFESGVRLYDANMAESWIHLIILQRMSVLAVPGVPVAYTEFGGAALVSEFDLHYQTQKRGTIPEYPP